jgi:hypothetical protein
LAEVSGDVIIKVCIAHSLMFYIIIFVPIGPFLGHPAFWSCIGVLAEYKPTGNK